jgi:hypothetical protein
MPDILPRLTSASDKKYFPPYKEPDINFMKEQAKKLIAWLWKDNNNPVLSRNIIPDFKCILEIVDMVERRRIYYHIFHNKMNMSESKEIALYCYWILKLHPFLKFQNNKPIKQVNEVNAIITYRLLLNMVGAIKRHFPNDSLDSFLHSFRYHDLSKEAMIAFCECLFEEPLTPISATQTVK